MLSFKDFIKEEMPLQGSKKIKYVELDMLNLAKSASDLVDEDDGPHTYKQKPTDSPNFTTVDDPTRVINQPNSAGNVDSNMIVAPKESGKPGKALKKASSKCRMGYGPEDLSGAVGGVAIGEACSSKMYKKRKIVAEGSERGHYARRGAYAKDRQAFLNMAASSDASKGLTGHPHEDGRSHSRTHTTPYNKGLEDYEADKKRGESLRKPKKQVAVKLPTKPLGSHDKNDRLAAVLDHIAAKRKK